MTVPVRKSPGSGRVDQELFSLTVTDALERGESVWIRVRGESMRPWLRPGDRVRIVPLGGRMPRRGDVALFLRAPDHPVLHRVIRVVRADGMWMADCLGDAEHGRPERVPADRVLGIMETTALARAGYRLARPFRRGWQRLRRRSPQASAADRPLFERLRAVCAAALRGERAGADDGKADAAELLALAERHRVVPLLAAGWPDEAPSSLHRRVLALAQNTARIERELGNIARTLLAARVDFLVCKGPAMARQAYSAADLRAYDDLDLWVADADFDPALRALKAAGYVWSPPLDAHGEACARRAGIEATLVHPVNRRLVEMSCGDSALAPTPSAAFEIRAAAVELDVAGAVIRAPAPVHALLLACRHGAQHGWDRLGWVADVAGLWRRLSPAERAETISTARRWRMATMLGLGLHLAAGHFHADLDGEAGGLAGTPRVRRLADRAALDAIRPDSLRMPRRARVRFEAAAMDGPGRRLRVWTESVFVPTLLDIQSVPLPPRLYGLYVVIRPLRLLGHALRRLRGG